MVEEDQPTRDSFITISQMAREFDVTPRTLRFYEDKGLLSPKREGQTRLYSYKERARLKLILQGKRVGVPLDDIREILDLYSLEDGERAQLIKAKDRLALQLETLTQQREDIDAALVEIRNTLSELDAQIAKLPVNSTEDKMTAFAKHAEMTMNTAQSL